MHLSPWTGDRTEKEPVRGGGAVCGCPNVASVFVLSEADDEGGKRCPRNRHAGRRELPTAGVITRPLRWPDWIWAIAGVAWLVMFGLHQPRPQAKLSPTGSTFIFFWSA